MSARSDRPLVVLGSKVGDAESIARWAAEGRLPTIQSIMDRGCHGRIAGPDRFGEHGSATTLFTGLPADRHGHYYFRQLRPGTYRLEPHGSAHITARPFWALDDVFRGPVAIVDVPEGRAIPGLPGSQLANWAYHIADVIAVEPTAEPPELLGEIEALVGPPPETPSLHPTRSDPGKARAHLEHLLDGVRTKGRVVRHVVGRQPADVVVATFDEPHAASHLFWFDRLEAEAPSDDPVLRDAIRTVYEAMDREMGRILDEVGGVPNVVVLSLFGMGDRLSTQGLNEIVLRELGYEVPRAAGGGSLRPIDVARQLVPAGLRRALSRYLPAGRQEEILADRLARGIDWSRTTAFSLPSLYTGLLRVNLRGREPEGIVDPGDYDALLSRIEADLGRLEVAATGEPAIESIVRASELFGGGPPEILPDLFVEWRGGPRLLDRVAHPGGELRQERPAFCPGSEETLVGFLAAAGPDVGGRGAIGDVAIGDLAPTFLTLLGSTPPDAMPGRPLELLLQRTSV